MRDMERAETRSVVGCCRALQRVAGCCSVLCVAVCCSVSVLLLVVAVCCSVLQRVTARYNVLQCSVLQGGEDPQAALSVQVIFRKRAL